MQLEKMQVCFIIWPSEMAKIYNFGCPGRPKSEKMVVSDGHFGGERVILQPPLAVPVEPCGETGKPPFPWWGKAVEELRCVGEGLLLLDDNVVLATHDVELHVAAGDGGRDTHGGEGGRSAEVVVGGGLGLLAGVVVLQLLREHGVDDAVLIRDGKSLGGELVAQILHAGLDAVGGAAGDDFLAGALGAFGLKLGIDGGGGVAVVAECHVHGLGGNLLPATELDVEGGLGAHNLRGGGDQRNPAKSLADNGNLCHHFVELVHDVEFLELVAEVGEHAAGHLVEEGGAVHNLVLVAGEAAQAAVDGLQHGRNLRELVLEVIGHDGAAVIALEQGEHAHAVRLAGAVGKGGDGAVHGVGSGVDAGHVGTGTQTGGVVGVNPDGKVGALLECLHEGCRFTGGDEAGHVLDDDAIGTHLCNLAAEVGEVFQVMHRGGGVADGAVSGGACLLGSTDGSAHVLRVVQAVEDTEDVHAMLDAQLDESLHHVVSVVRVTHEVLTAQQHHVRGVRSQLLEGVQSVKRVLTQETQTGVNGCTTPGLQGREAHGVKDGGDFEHLLGGHTRGCQRLVAVAQYSAVQCCGFHILKKF